jgi:hypothetical protein
MDEDDMDEDAFDGVDALDGLDDEFDDEFSLDAKKRRRSSVRVTNLFSKRVFDYTFLGVGSTTITLKRALKVPQFYYHWLALRIHNRDITNGSFTVQLFQTLPSNQDPQEFSATSASLSLGCSQVSTDAPPLLKTTTGSNFGPYFKVVMSISQGTASAKLYAELSAVLYSRPA